MFDVKTYKPDGSEGATIRGLSWVQMTSLQSALSQHGIRYFTNQVSDEAAEQSVHTDPPSACPACGTLPEEAEHDPTCPLFTAGR